MADILDFCDGQPVVQGSDLPLSLIGHQPGDTITLTVVRDGDEMSVDVTLGERPQA